MKLRIALAAATLAALAGCANSPYAIAQKFENLRNYQGKPAGLLVAGVGARTTWSFSSAGLVFRRVGTEDLGKVDYTPKSWNAPKREFATEAIEGYLYAQPLPPGDYEVHAKEGYYVSGNMTAAVALPVPVPVTVQKFTIHDGEIVYLGRVIFDSDRKGLGRLPDPRATVTDEQAADLALLKARGGAWAGGDVPVTAVLPPAANRKL